MSNMTQRLVSTFGLLSTEPIKSLRALQRAGVVPDAEPGELDVQHGGAIVDTDWAALTGAVSQEVVVTWRPDAQYIYSEHPPLFVGAYTFPPKYRNLVVANIDDSQTLSGMIDIMSGCEHEIFSWNGGPADGYHISDYMFAHSVCGHSHACSFRGPLGHSWLASRQWLTHGPWKLHYGKNDVTFVQFYDYDGDMPTMLEQARVGHERMGSSPIGGYLNPTLARPDTFRGEYDAEHKALVTRVHGRDVRSEEMLHAAVLRGFQSFGLNKPIEQVIFDFADGDAAKRHLHEIWLYGLTCRTRINNRVVDLNVGYDPEPDPPEWAQQILTVDLR